MKIKLACSILDVADLMITLLVVNNITDSISTSLQTRACLIARNKAITAR